MKEFTAKIRLLASLARQHTLGSTLEALTQRKLAEADAAVAIRN